VRSTLLRQLLLLDWDYRRRAGDDPTSAEYRTRFPDDSAAVEEVSRDMAEASLGTRATVEDEGPRNTPWSGGPAPGGAAEVAKVTETGAARYDLLREVGRGGIGVVFRGRDRHLGRELAVKVLSEAYRDRPEARRRFIAEARAGSRLQHPAIVPVYELGWFDDRRPCFTMKLVEGHTLAELLERRADPGPDLARLLAVFGQVCQAVAYAHARGVVHRDLKPANVMVGAFGEVQVMDWGFAKVLGGAGGTESDPDHDPVTYGGNGVSQNGVLMGTPAYMPPEQARGENARIGPRSDVFALGGDPV
jgi:serine/threonine protein kinase